MSSFDTCAVCARTILSGERTRTYLAPGAEKRVVCDLCRARAEQLGWVWEEAAGETAAPPLRRRESRGLGGLLRGRGAARRARQSDAGSDDPAPVPGPERSPDPAAPGAGVGRLDPVAESQGSRLERAAARFNSSEEAHTVAGLIRSLGAPWVSVGSAAGTPSEVRITVAWELSWYQWGVDLRDESRPVRPIDKGREMGQLDGSAKQWNAVADESGRIRIAAVAAGARPGKEV